MVVSRKRRRSRQRRRQWQRQRCRKTQNETRRSRRWDREKVRKGHVSNSNTQVCKVVPKVEEKSEDVELCHIEPEKVSEKFLIPQTTDYWILDKDSSNFHKLPNTWPGVWREGGWGAKACLWGRGFRRWVSRCTLNMNNQGFHKKHRKNCECCPGHYLIVNHYSSI